MTAAALDLAVGQVVIPEITPDDDMLRAALKYAAGGAYVLPVRPDDPKNAGRVLGAGWPAKTSRDPETIAEWFTGTPHVLALHAGRSGLWVADVDDPAAIPPALAEAIERERPPYQASRPDQPGRGHYPFGQPVGRMLGNATGELGKAWGEGRGRNGIIVLAPSPHVAEAAGAAYRWLRTGPVPEMPAELAALLPDAGDTADAASDAAVRRFATEHAGSARPEALRGILSRLEREVADGSARHPALLRAACWAAREAAGGLFPAAQAFTALEEWFVDAMSGPGRASPRVLSRRAAEAEARGAIAWAVGQAEREGVEAIRARLADRPAPGQGRLLRPVAPPPEADEQDTADDEQDQAVDDGEQAAAEEPEGEQAREDRSSSWEPVDLAEGWDHDSAPVLPTLLRRADGPCLLYPGEVHSIYGESESGKSWVALIATAEVLRDGGRVLYVDHESDPGPVKSRLRALGVTREQARRLDYVRPDGPRDAAWLALLDRRYTLAVVDGVSVAIAAEGGNSDSTDETARWLEAVPRVLASRTGAAVLTVDHVTKSRDGRGRHPIGSQQKLNAITGSAFMARVHRPFGRGQVGELILRVTKDRPGGLRPECGPVGEHNTQEAARIILDATDPDRIRVEVRRWSVKGTEESFLDGGRQEGATSWRDVETPLPDDVVSYSGKGRGAICDLARFMRHAADGGVGQSLTDAQRELGALKGADGKPLHTRWTVKRAWGVLLEDMKPPRLQMVRGTGAETGPATWVSRDGE